jgi:choice-of-anchor A domain-containing protein
MNSKYHKYFRLPVLAALLLSLTQLAQAQTNSLGLDYSLNLLSFGNLFVPGSDVQGRVAVGGNASIANYSINTVTGTQATYSGTGLTVGGNLNFVSGATWGNTMVGGNLTVGSVATPLANVSFSANVQVAGNLEATNHWISAPSISYGGNVSGVQQWQSPAPTQVASSVQLGINFATEQQRLTSLSHSFDTLANTGNSYMEYSTLVLNANHADVAVFDLNGTDVIHNMRLDNFGPNTTVILNVHGQSVDFKAGGYTNFNLSTDLAVGHVLFNLPDATQVSFASGVYASFLAPTAQFNTLTGGFIGGQVVAGSWNGSAQVNDNPFVGAVAAVPEPETYAMMLAGLLAVAGAARRRRAG